MEGYKREGRDSDPVQARAKPAQLQQLITVMVTQCLLVESLCINNEKFWEELIAYFPFTTYRIFYDTDRTENSAPNSSIVACIFAAAERVCRAVA
jgi:hypothetical protein